MSYQDLRDHDGHLLARLDADRWLLEIQKRGEKTLFDLRTLLAPESAKENDDERLSCLRGNGGVLPIS